MYAEILSCLAGKLNGNTISDYHISGKLIHAPWKGAVKMNEKESAPYIISDAQAIQRLAWDAAMNKDAAATYLHAIDVIADHILQQAMVFDTVPAAKDD